MIQIARLLPVCLLLLTAAGEAPSLAPTRDVVVSYRVVRAAAQGGPAKLVVSHDAASRHVRIDSFIFADGKAPYEAMIVSQSDNKTLVLAFARQAAIEAEGTGFARPGLGFAAGSSFQQRGGKTVTGLPCTEWEVTPPKGGTDAAAEPWTACVTADGVLLRSVSSVRELEATSVKFAPVPPAVFVAPPDLKRVVAVPAKK